MSQIDVTWKHIPETAKGLTNREKVRDWCFWVGTCFSTKMSHKLDLRQRKMVSGIHRAYENSRDAFWHHTTRFFQCNSIYNCCKSQTNGNWMSLFRFLSFVTSCQKVWNRIPQLMGEKSSTSKKSWEGLLSQTNKTERIQVSDSGQPRYTWVAVNPSMDNSKVLPILRFVETVARPQWCFAQTVRNFLLFTDFFTLFQSWKTQHCALTQDWV